ncbi:HD domain-containing protein [Bdellovibrionota bacterium FG-1]
MEIRDVIHGSIRIEDSELAIIDSRYFQRLRQIKQLGFAENSFPSATHNRYIHSLGAMHIATRAFETIFAAQAPGHLVLATESPRAFARFRAVVRLSALLHDIGHGPLSHTTEFAMPDVRELQIPGSAPKAKARKATHEDYTLKIILDSSLTPALQKAGALHGFKPVHIAALIDSEVAMDDDFFIEKIRGEAIDFRPILKQLISSELDADRMDYLRRDSLHAGVSYGQFDFDWLVGSLTSHIKGGHCYLALHHRALYAFEDFLISRFHMFLMVYFHYKSVVFDEMLGQYLSDPQCDYHLPADIEEYCEFNDAHLSAHLAKSTNKWACRIADKVPYRMLIELHSGIPATQTAAREQTRLLARIQKDLKAQNIHYLLKTSTGELSKYFQKKVDPFFVRYDNHYSAPSYIPIEQCTDLFQRYSEKRSITRLYVSHEDYTRLKNKGRDFPLPYEEEEQGQFQLTS